MRKEIFLSLLLQLPLLVLIFAFPSMGYCQANNYAPRNGAWAWPVIHQNDRGTKEIFVSGPVFPKTKDRAFGSKPILAIVGQGILYEQEVYSGVVRAFDANALASGAKVEVPLGVTWPFSGGGIIDQNHDTWWTGGGRLVRFRSDLQNPVTSQKLVPSSNQSIWNAFYNSVNLLGDGTALVGTMSPDLYLVDVSKQFPTEFPVLERIQKTEFLRRTEAGYTNVFSNSDSYGPRPISDSEGNFYFASSNALAKVRYLPALRTFERQVEWAFLNPENPTDGGTPRSSLALSNPIILGSLICIASKPIDLNLYEQVYCLDIISGAVRFQFQPFPTPGISAAHTLGGNSQARQLFVIANSPDMSGGVAGFDIDTGQRLWPNVALKDISESFVIADGNNSLYIASKSEDGRLFFLNRIDTRSGARFILDVIPSNELPTATLGALDASGNLFFQTPLGLTRYHD